MYQKQSVMKRFLLLLGVALLAVAALADSNEMPVQMHQLPDAARETVKKYFGEVKVSSAVMEQGISPSYEVTLVDGTILEFDSRGQWRDIERPSAAVPDALIPMQILKFVASNYPGQQIRGIELDGKMHDILLSNGLELKFNRKYQLVEADH